jgi:hypothetical protein
VVIRAQKRSSPRSCYALPPLAGCSSGGDGEPKKRAESTSHHDANADGADDGSARLHIRLRQSKLLSVEAKLHSRRLEAALMRQVDGYVGTLLTLKDQDELGALGRAGRSSARRLTVENAMSA